MSKIKTVFRCSSCGAGAAKWAGRCASCGDWNTMAEELDGPAGAPMVFSPSEPASLLKDIDPTGWQAKPTGIAEMDRVLGGGFVPGSATLLGGEPGIGKSTLLLQLLLSLAKGGTKCLMISGEESRQQIRLRSSRLGALPDNVWLASESSLPAVLGHIGDVKPDVVVIDSIQTMHDPALASAPGSVGQVRECAHVLVREAKARGITTILVGHVTKDGGLAGPRVLEHLVDTVLSFDGDRHHALRLLRAVKHRFGATGELGLFEMLEAGLIGVADPGALFLSDRQHGASGSIVTPIMEGARPLLVETQALVMGSPMPMPRRTGQGVDNNRLALLLAVLEQRAGIQISGCEVYASAIGGVKLSEPAADLGLALALASAFSEVAIPSDVVAMGEIGLAGEVRAVAHAQRRLAEAARLGFKTAVVPASTPDPGLGPNVKMTLIRVGTLAEAVKKFDLHGGVGGTKVKTFSGGGGNGGGGNGGEQKGKKSQPWFDKKQKSGGQPSDNYDVSQDRNELWDPFEND
jgi:DNA repair protein RadA/Sms